MLFVITLSSANAAEININSSDNLGQTIANANDEDTINLENGIYTNNVTNITINKNLTIAGKNSESTAIDAKKTWKNIFNN